MLTIDDEVPALVEWASQANAWRTGGLHRLLEQQAVD